MKNYIGFVNDHSGSIARHTQAMIADYNATTKAFCDAATEQMLDTVVSVVALGYPTGDQITRQVVISNPHVLRPITEWSSEGGTPLWDAIGNMIELFESLPDASDEKVSFLVLVTTDGEEQHSRKYNTFTLRTKITALQKTGRWTFVFRVPEGAASKLSSSLGVPLDNIQQWNTRDSTGISKSTASTRAAVDSFYKSRASGQKSSTVFYAQASAVDVSLLKDITKDVSLYVVGQHEMGIEVKDFILKHRMKYLKGSAFYQLTKTEARVEPSKLIAVRDRTTGKIFAGKDARKMIGLPDDRNARLHPGDHGNYDIFIQSFSVNRKLVAGTGVLYWEAIGTEFTEADLAYLKPKEPTPAVVQLPAVAPTTKPTPSPVPVTKKPVGPMVDGKPVTVYTSRKDARASGKPVQDAKVTGAIPVANNIAHRWYTFN